MKRPIVFIALGMLLAFGIMATILAAASLASADTHLRVVANSDIHVSLPEHNEQAPPATAAESALATAANQTRAEDTQDPGATLIRKLDEERRGGLRHVLKAFGGTAQSPAELDEASTVTPAATETALATRPPTATRRPPAPTRTATHTAEPTEATPLPGNMTTQPTNTPMPPPPVARPTVRPTAPLTKPTVPSVQPTSAGHDGDGENHGTPQPAEPTRVRQPEPTRVRQPEPTEVHRPEPTEVHNAEPTEQHREKTPEPHD